MTTMVFVKLVAWAAASALFLGCSENVEGEDQLFVGDTNAISIMQFNLAGRMGSPDGDVVVSQIASAAPDFVLAQECSACEWVLAELGGDYSATTPAAADNTIFYDNRKWQMVWQDQRKVGGPNDDGWGQRDMRMALFSRVGNEAAMDVTAEPSAVYVFSTHWCVSIRKTDDLCDATSHVRFAEQTLQAIEQRQNPSLPLIFAGDLNVFDGFEDSVAVQTLIQGGLIDTLREVSSAKAITFQGNTWAPPGRIDYTFTTRNVHVVASEVDDSVPVGQGSDHYPTLTKLMFLPAK